MKRTLASVLLAFCLPGIPRAQTVVDYRGFAWEEGGFPGSLPGEHFSLVGVVDRLDRRIGAIPYGGEATVWLTGLESAGGFDTGGGIFRIDYTGGMLELWTDPAGNSDFGTDPPNATVPASFRDGNLLLGARMVETALFFDIATGAGALESTIECTHGSAFPGIRRYFPEGGYTIAALLASSAAGGAVPQGYDLQIDAIVGFPVLLPVELRTWGAVKGLFRR